MSKNDLILVACDKRQVKNWYYVIYAGNADTDWNIKYCKKNINIMRKQSSKRTSDRSTALVLAHDIDKKIKTEYGVREMNIHH